MVKVDGASEKLLRVTLGDLILKNPVMTASGTFGYGQEFTPYFDVNTLGAIVVKGISVLPRRGNPPPRIAETACGMLNSIGLQNDGLDDFVKRKIPYLQSLNTCVIANILGDSIEEYQILAERLSLESAIDAIEVNISCPNVKHGGVAFGVNSKMAHEVVSSIRSSTDKHLMVKLSPNVTNIVDIAKAVEDGGADSISLINTLLGMAIDIHTRKPKLTTIVGGLSGPAIKPVALRMVWQVSQAVKLPVIGIGGISSADDALEFIIAGASAVQVGTSNLINPTSCRSIISGIHDYLVHHNFGSVAKLRSSLIC